MPAFLTHWLVAQEVALKYIDESIKGYEYFKFSSGPEDNKFKVIEKEKTYKDELRRMSDLMKHTIYYKMLKDHHLKQEENRQDIFISHYVFFGGIGPDFTYFYELFFGYPGKSKWADYFHYNKQADFLIEVIKKAKNIADNNDKMRLISYALGHATHLAVDAIMHPFINLIAGVYRDQIYYKKIILLPKVGIHTISECHQDSWLAQKYFGRKFIDDGPSWTKYLPPFPPLPTPNPDSPPQDYAEKLRLHTEMKEVLNSIYRVINTTYFSTPPDEYLETSYKKVCDWVLSDYDIALAIPKEPNPALVQHEGIKNSEYVDYVTLITKKAVEAAFYACESVIKLIESTMSYEDECIFRSELRNWNMDTGYWIDVDMNENEHPRITWRHSWCRD